LANYFAEHGFVYIKSTSPDTQLDFVDLEAFSENNFSIELYDIASGSIKDYQIILALLQKKILEFYQNPESLAIL